MNRIINHKKFFLKIISNKAAQNFIIVGFIAVFQLTNNIILGRDLKKEEYGFYSFVFNNIAILLSILLLFGRSTSILRFFSTRDFQHYHWKKYLLKYYKLISIPLIIIMLCIKLFYNFNWYWFGMGVLSSYILCCTKMFADLLRSKEYFITTLLFERIHPVILTVILLILHFGFNSVNIKSASVAKLISFSVQIPIIIYIFINWKQGKKIIDKTIFKDSWSFWELNLSVIVLGSIDAFFIAKILNFQELALYSIMLSLLQIYEFARISIFQVYSQKFSKTNSINVKSFTQLIILIIIIITLFYLLSANFLLDILFKGKYTVTLLQLVLFCLYSSIMLIYVIPSCYLIGQSSSRDLRFMLGINISSIVIKIFFIMLLSQLGITGFLIAGITTHLFRTSAGYYMVFKNKRIKGIK